MKKNKFLLLIPALALIISPISTLVSANDDLTLSDEVISNFKNKLSSALELRNNITYHYDSPYSTVVVIDQVDDSNRSRSLFINKTLIQEQYLKENKSGKATESYLSISNTVETRDILDEENNNIVFDDEFASPFISLTSLTNSKINSYFEVNREGTNYILKATSLAYGTLSNPILNFYVDYDGLIWDSSVTRSIENLRLTIDENGSPLSLSFDKIKKDIFGGIRETNNVTLTSIDKVSDLAPKSSLLSSDEKNAFQTKMSNFQNLLNQGNFTQNINIAPRGSDQAIAYSNYYELNSNKESSTSEAMICSLGVEEATYGETFVGIFKVNNTFQTVGISPDEDYSSIITDTKTNDISQVVPRLNDISADFFTYNKESDIYTFDFNNFVYGDTYFCGTILISLFGIVDPVVHNLGLYIYDESSYYFDSLSIGFDENGYAYGVLTYHYYNITLNSVFNFTDVGSTILSEKEDISKVITYILS